MIDPTKGWEEYMYIRDNGKTHPTPKEIATKLNIEGSGAYVRVSQLKKQAVDKLVENVDHSQVLDYL